MDFQNLFKIGKQEACLISKGRAIWRWRFIFLTLSLYLPRSTLVRQKKTCAKILERFNVAKQQWLRWIMSVFYWDHFTNEEVHHRSSLWHCEWVVYALWRPYSTLTLTPTAQDHRHMEINPQDANQAASVQHSNGLSLMIYTPWTLHGIRSKQPQLIDYIGGDLLRNASNGAEGPKSPFYPWCISCFSLWSSDAAGHSLLHCAPGYLFLLQQYFPFSVAGTLLGSCKSWKRRGKTAGVQVKLRLLLKQVSAGKQRLASLVTCDQTARMEGNFSSMSLLNHVGPGSMTQCYLRSVYPNSPVVCPAVPAMIGMYNCHESNTQSIYDLNWVSSVSDMTYTLLSMALLDTQSITNKTLLLNDFILSKKFDFLFLTETWQCDGDYSSLIELCPGGYSFTSQPRTSYRGGLTVVYRSLIYCRSLMEKNIFVVCTTAG